ncbi:MAG: single-stranded DNA-binding protein [Syntrophobacterales bacterium]|nr:single-stranded DNA-binding protein [Syntrophobacterales bacterium]
MKSVNRIQITGYVREPKIIDAAHGKMATFSIGTKRYDGKNEAGESIFHEDWFNCQVFGKMAENLKVKKGDFVFLSGDMRTNRKRWDCLLQRPRREDRDYSQKSRRFGAGNRREVMNQISVKLSDSEHKILQRLKGDRSISDYIRKSHRLFTPQQRLE